MVHSTDQKKKDINEDEHSDWFSDHSANTESRESTTSIYSTSSDDNSSSTKKLGWLMRKTTLTSRFNVSDRKNEGPRSHVEAASDLTDQILKKKASKASEMEMLKEHFTKLLLCEDMSGHGNGVCTALAISNAITNLCANVFGQLWRLEPLTPDKKLTWRREMEWLLSVCNHIVEFAPTWQSFPDGTTSEVMCCRPRSDLYVNLPALRKLDNMLLDILNGFSDNTEFWYVDKGGTSPSPESDHGDDKSVPVPKLTISAKDKWWLPVPRVPLGGLKKHTIKALTHKRDCANQIHKAAKAINTMTLSDMEVPESYYNNLPKNARACLGDAIYSNVASEHFAPDCLLDCLDLSSDHVALEIANRVETAIYVWRKRHHQLDVMKSPADHLTKKGRSSSKSSWGIGRDHRNEEFLAQRAESLMLCLRQRFPKLRQTTLDDSKIQCNKDIGKAILESYSRVLSSLALSITSRIEDVLYVDEITKQTDKLSLMKKLGLTPCRKVSIPHQVPVSGTNTPVRTTTPLNYRSPVPSFLSPVSGPKTPCKNGNDNNKISRRGLGVRRVLANYIGGDVKATSTCGGNVDDVSDKTIVGRRLF